MIFFNTLGRKKEEFRPYNPNNVGMYTCGPTVYDYAHIGNLRAYVFADLIRRALIYRGFEVNQIMNITDIGHLSSDADEGVDKMTKGLLREGKELNLKNMREMAEFYAERFKDDLGLLNILPPSGMYFASDYISEDISLIKKLEQNNFTYQTKDGIYFDTSKMTDYGILWGGSTEQGAKSEGFGRIAKNPEKKNSEDFALWKFNDKLGFPSPWGQGFPGWHLECSALSMKFLGEQFDIHTGGIDHIAIHHTNEIAQSESATGKKPFVKFWMHNEFVDFGGMKMAKSEGNFLKLESIMQKGHSPLSYRFWLLMGSYRTKMNFNWEVLEGSEIALKRLYRLYLNLGENIGDINPFYQNKFIEYLDDDLDTPKILSMLWDLLKDKNVSDQDKKATVLDFDRVLALGFDSVKDEIIPEEVTLLSKERDEARKNKDFKKSDELRKKINDLGYEVNDGENGSVISKKLFL